MPSSVFVICLGIVTHLGPAGDDTRIRAGGIAAPRDNGPHRGNCEDLAQTPRDYI